MATLGYLAVGVAIGGVVGRCGRASLGSCLAVGGIGAMLGAASAVWLGNATPRGAGQWLAVVVGAMALAGLWGIARRLFLNPAERPVLES